MTWEQKKQQSIDLLDKYKDEITEEAYKNILYVIGTQAIENMFVTEKSIVNMIRVEKKELTADELIVEYKREWGVD